MDSTSRRHLMFLSAQAKSAVAKNSTAVHALCGLLVLLYLVALYGPTLQFLVIIPHFLIPPNCYVWTIFTHCFVELHFVHLIADLAVMVLSGKLLQPLWGTRELLTFFFVTNGVSGVLTCIFYLCIYSYYGNSAYLFHTYIHGLPAFLAGFSVAVKQIMPDEVLANSPLGKLRNRHIPLCLLLLALLLLAVSLLDLDFLVQFVCGFWVSWLYLRFWQRHSAGAGQGDMSDSFSFASFFPGAVQPVVALVSNFTFGVLVRLHICKAAQRRYDLASSSATITIALPGSESSLDAQRRRIRAIRALDERLKSGVHGGSRDDGQWPSLTDEPQSPLGASLAQQQNYEQQKQVQKQMEQALRQGQVARQLAPDAARPLAPPAVAPPLAATPLDPSESIA